MIWLERKVDVSLCQGSHGQELQVHVAEREEALQIFAPPHIFP